MSEFDPLMSTATADKVVVTLKAGTGYDAPWVVFHGDTIGEVADRLGAAEATGFLAVVATASENLKGHYNAGKVLGAQPTQAPAAAEAQYYAPQSAPQQAQQGWGQPQAPQAPQQAYSAPQQGQELPPGPAPSCMHGEKQFKPSGTSKTGKPYGATWNCPVKMQNWKDPNGCPPQWINNR